MTHRQILPLALLGLALSLSAASATDLGQPPGAGFKGTDGELQAVSGPRPAPAQSTRTTGAPK